MLKQVDTVHKAMTMSSVQQRVAVAKAKTKETTESPGQPEGTVAKVNQGRRKGLLLQRKRQPRKRPKSTNTPNRPKSN